MFSGKNYDNAFYFSKAIRRYIVVYFPGAIRDNVVYDDFTITSSLHGDAIMLGINFLFS